MRLVHKETLRWAGLFVGTIAIAALIVPSFMERTHQGHTTAAPTPVNFTICRSPPSRNALTPEQSIATALQHRAEGHFPEALEVLDQAILKYPDFIAARFNRGVLYHSQGKFKEALADFDHCIAIDPRQAAPYFNRATTHEALGQKNEAIADLKHFIERSNSEAWRKTAQHLLDKLEGRGAPDRQGKSVPGDSS